MMTIEKALEIASMAHEFQKDKCGCAYIMHPLRVAVNFTDEKHFIVAVLHDVLEDGNDGIKNKLIFELQDDKDILEALELLNHQKNVPYLEYVESLAENELARSVKKADLLDNMNQERCEKALSFMKNEKDINRFKRKQATYMEAYTYLSYVSDDNIPSGQIIKNNDNIGIQINIGDNNGTIHL